MKHVSIMWELQIYVRQYLESLVNSKHDCSQLDGNASFDYMDLGVVVDDRVEGHVQQITATAG